MDATTTVPLGRIALRAVTRKNVLQLSTNPFVRIQSVEVLSDDWSTLRKVDYGGGHSAAGPNHICHPMIACANWS